jgi:hypothetical protein
MRSSILIAFLLISLSLKAQLTSHSPFSSYGYGERYYGGDAITGALGQSSVAYFDSTYLNYRNPASYNSLSKEQPLFSVGVEGRISSYTQNSATSNNGYGMVDHFALAIPIKTHFGLAFGLRPFSRRGYEISDAVEAGSDSIKYIYSGNGGVNEAFVGLSSSIFKLRSTHLSIGANIGYLFGSSTNERKSYLMSFNSYSGGVEKTSYRFSSIHYEIGLSLHQRINDVHSFKIGATMEPAQKATGYLDRQLFIAGNVNNPNTYSLLYDTTNVSGHLNLSPAYTVGFSYLIRRDALSNSNRTRNSEWQIHASYSSNDWSQFSTEFESLTDDYNYQSTTKFSAGIQFTPEVKFIENAVTTNFVERMKYRAGFYSATLPYLENSTSVKEIGTTFGIGMPILAQQALSSINFSVTIGKRGNGLDQGLNESFLGMNMGVIISPSFYDRWFRKRKLD